MNTLPYKLGVYLGTDSEHTLSLKELISNQFADNKIPNALALTITLAPSVAVDIIDDLVSPSDIQEATSINHSIEFSLNRYCVLNYQLAFQASDKQSTNPHTNNIEKDLTVRLIGRNAQATLICSCHGTQEKIFSFKTLQDHHAANTKSNIIIKGVLDDAAQLLCTSMIQVAKTAHHTVAEQSNKNLLLSKNAKIVAIPQLEIKNKDVACKHGAAISSIDNEHLFYLQSRGVEEETAKKMVVDGFLKI
jgi:Fe-S cluster assembly protein SufD